MTDVAAGKVLVIGSLNMDLVTTVTAFPKPGETLLGSDYETHHGGKGANQAVAAARMGAAVSFFGRVGDDAFGARLRSGLANEGIDIHGLQAVPGPSGVAFITLDENGQNTIIVAPGANARLGPEDLTEADFEAADIVVLQLEVPAPTVRKALALAQQVGTRTLVNAAPAGTLRLDELRGCDVLVVNEGEAAALLGEREHETPQRLLNELAPHFPAAVITLGSAGSAWRQGSTTGSVDPYQVEVVDTTGAGDAFVGAVAASLARGLALDKAVDWGNAAGALAVGRMGAQPSLPTFEEVRALLG